MREKTTIDKKIRLIGEIIRKRGEQGRCPRTILLAASGLCGRASTDYGTLTDSLCNRSLSAVAAGLPAAVITVHVAHCRMTSFAVYVEVDRQVRFTIQRDLFLMLYGYRG